MSSSKPFKHVRFDEQLTVAGDQSNADQSTCESKCYQNIVLFSLQLNLYFKDSKPTTPSTVTAAALWRSMVTKAADTPVQATTKAINTQSAATWWKQHASAQRHPKVLSAPPAAPTSSSFAQSHPQPMSADPAPPTPPSSAERHPTHLSAEQFTPTPSSVTVLPTVPSPQLAPPTSLSSLASPISTENASRLTFL